MKKTRNIQTLVELDGKLDQLTQWELAKIAGGVQSSPEKTEQMSNEESSQASDINPYNPPPPPPVH